MLNSEPSSELDKQHRNAQTEQVKMAATEAGSPRRLGLNLNLSVQPHTNAYHWPHSTVAEDTSPSRSKGCTDDDDDDDEDDRDMDDRDMDDDDMMDCRQDEDCSPEDEQDILEMQREERETLNQLARQLASGSRLITPMLQHLVYQHPGLSVQPSQMHQQQLQLQLQQPSSVAVSLTTAALSRHATAAAADLSPKSSHSGDVPMSGGRSADVQSPSASRNNEAQSWTFEEQFRQLYSAGNESDRRTFLDSLFSFMQEQGTPISRLPIMAKRVLDLYTLYKLVVQRGGIVAVITKKLWQEIIRGLGLPPSITSAAFTLRTQYVKYLYAYESRMNQFSTLDELNMAIAGNRREGRRNKSLMYSDMPPPPPGHPHHHHHSHHQQVHGGHPHSMMGGGAPPQPSSQQQQQQQQQQQHQQQQQPPSSHHHHHYANVLAAEDRFRHLAAAIIDNHHHAAAAAAAAAAGVGVDHPRLRMQSCSPPQHQQQQLQLQSECKTSAVALHQTPRSPATIGLPPPPPMPPSSLFNGHQPSSYQQLHQQQQQQHQSNAVQSTNEQTNKQRELLSMLMWMDIVRANQTAMPRLPISSLPSSPSAAAAAAAAAYTAAAALNLTPTYKGQPVVVVPEQSEALNLGKKRTSNNNNSEDENVDGDGDGPDEYDGGRESMSSAAKRIKMERSSPPVSGCSSDDEKAVAKATSNGSPSPPQPSAADDATYRSDMRRSSSPIDEDVVEMDINTSASAGPSSNNGLAISVTRRTKNGVYIGQLTKNNALVNGGLNNNVNPFVLHLNGDLYTGQLQLQQQQVANN